MAQKEVIDRNLSDVTVEDILAGASGNTSVSKAKKAIGMMKQQFADLAFENQQLELKKKKISMELKKHPTLVAFAELKKQIRRNKKRMEQLVCIYQGGLKLADELGIKIDTSVMKMIQEGRD